MTTNYYLIETPKGPMLWRGSVERDTDATWLISTTGVRVWWVPRRAQVLRITAQDACEFIAEQQTR